LLVLHAAQAASGLSVADYARELGVSVPTLYLWRRRLGSARSEDRPAKLIEVTVTRPTASASDNNMLVRIGDGRRIVVVPRGFDGDDLRRLIAVLESC